MTRLPYMNSRCNPVQSQQRIQKMLVKFGVDRISFDTNLKDGELSIKFLYKGIPVKLPVNYARLADRYLDEDPYTDRKRISEEDWIANKREIASRAAFSILEDFLRGAITMVEMGVLPFEDVFIGSFINSKGIRLGDIIIPHLPEFIGGKLALTEGKE